MNNSIERRQGGSELDGVLVSSGEIVIVQEETVLAAVVARGVAVCIWDKNGVTAGMSHFTKPSIYDSKQATGQYGNVSVLTLMRMLKDRAPNGCFEAQVFGGALKHDGESIGAENVDIAKRILKSREIPVVSEDIGGNKGRKILFYSSSGHTVVLKVHNLRKDDWND